MALDFPADPAGQTPVNVFSPTSTPLATNNGATYIWDGVKWNGEFSSGESSIIISDTAPDLEPGGLWWNTGDGRLYIYYDDGDTEQWVDASPASGSTGGGGPGVSKLIAGNNIDLNPADGIGEVTISSTAGGGGGNAAGCDAWAKTLSDGQINASYNIASVVWSTITETYDYTFLVPMPDKNYALTTSATYSASVPRVGAIVAATENGFSLAFQRFDTAAKIQSSHSIVIHGTSP